MKLFIAVMLVATFAHANSTVSFKTPKDHAVVSSPVHVEMITKGFKVTPAGTEMENKNAGHFHLVVDGVAIKGGEVIPKDDTHLHFGNAQTSTDLKLAPGEHTLTLQMGDGAHRVIGEPQTIHITVK